MAAIDPTWRHRRAAVCGLLACLAGAATAQVPLVLPSGLEATFLDRIVERQAGGETWMILRYLSPQIGRGAGKLGYDEVAPDIDRLCNSEGLAAAAETGGIDQLVVALMDRTVAWGSNDPEAVVFMGFYLPTEGGCVWQ